MTLGRFGTSTFGQEIVHQVSMGSCVVSNMKYRPYLLLAVGNDSVSTLNVLTVWSSSVAECY